MARLALTRTQSLQKRTISMHASSTQLRAQKPNAVAAILWGRRLISGVPDLVYVVTFVTVRGLEPIVVPQAIASGLLGMKSFERRDPNRSHRPRARVPHRLCGDSCVLAGEPENCFPD